MRGPPDRKPVPNARGRGGGEGGGVPPTQQRAPEARNGGRGGSPRADHLGTPPLDGDQDEDGDPPPPLRVQTARGQEGVGEGQIAPMARGQIHGKVGDSPLRQHVLPSHDMPEQEGGNPPSQDEEGSEDGPRAPMGAG